MKYVLHWKKRYISLSNDYETRLYGILLDSGKRRQMEEMLDYVQPDDSLSLINYPTINCVL